MANPTDIEILTQCDPAVLDRLASHQEWQVRAHVAGNQFVTSETLARLSADPCAAVRAAVAHNSNTAASILSGLTADSDPEVREEALAHPGLPSAVLVRAVRADAPDPPPLPIVARWVRTTDQRVPMELAVRCLASDDFEIRRIGIEALLRPDA